MSQFIVVVTKLTDPKHCLICNSNVEGPSSSSKGRQSRQSTSSCTRALAELVQYPQQIQFNGGDPLMDKDNEQIKHSVFCGSCTKKMRDVRLTFEKLLRLHQDLERFQLEIATEIRACVRADESQRKIRQQILDGLQLSQSGSSSPSEELKRSKIPAKLRECSVRLERMDQTKEVEGRPRNRASLISDPVFIKEEPLEHSSVELEDVNLGFDYDDHNTIPAEVEDREDGDNKGLDINEYILPDEDRIIEINTSASAPGEPILEPTRKSKPFLCCRCRFPGCEFVSYRRSFVTDHVDKAHPNGADGMFMCPKCGSCFKTEHKRDEHVKGHDATFPCRHCPVTLKHFRSLHRHYQSKHPEQKLPSKKDFPDNPGINYPRRKINSNVAVVVAKTKEKAAAIVSSVNFTCPYCAKKCTSRHKLRAHLPVHVKRYKCTVEGCGMAFSESNVLRFHQIRFHPELNIPNYACPHCDYKTNRPASLKWHIAAKHMAHEAVHHCPREGCKFTYVHPHKLKVHIESIHERKTNVLCPECGRAFYSKGNLNAHIKWAHSGIRPHVCAVCGKGFRQPRELKRHEPLHGNECPFICELCGFRFPTGNNLHGHIYHWHKKGTARIGEQPKKGGKFNQDLVPDIVRKMR